MVHLCNVVHLLANFRHAKTSRCSIEIYSLSLHALNQFLLLCVTHPNEFVFCRYIHNRPIDQAAGVANWQVSQLSSTSADGCRCSYRLAEAVDRMRIETFFSLLIATCLETVRPGFSGSEMVPLQGNERLLKYIRCDRIKI